MTVDELVREHAEAGRQLDELTKQAKNIGERLAVLAEGLSSYPERVLIGSPERPASDSRGYLAVSGLPVPSIESLAALTARIRQAAERVRDLRERLILAGRKDVVGEPDGFFK
jgi:hypothetical protein